MIKCWYLQSCFQIKLHACPIARPGLFKTKRPPVAIRIVGVYAFNIDKCPPVLGQILLEEEIELLQAERGQIDFWKILMLIVEQRLKIPKNTEV